MTKKNIIITSFIIFSLCFTSLLYVNYNNNQEVIHDSIETTSNENNDIFPLLSSGSSTEPPSWANLGPYGGFLLDIDISNSSPNVLWGACDTNGGVYKSVDGGNTWECKGLEKISVIKVSIDPENPDKVFAGCKGGLYRTMDGGDTWEIVSMAGNHVMSVAVNPYNTSHVYMGPLDPKDTPGYGLGIYLSTIGGEPGSFNNISDANFHKNLATDFAFNSSNYKSVYVSSGSGIFRTYDNGTTWDLINTPNWNPMRCVAARAGVVFGGSMNSSGKPGAIFKTVNDGATWEQKIDLNGTIWDIIIDHNNVNHVYAAVKDSLVDTLGIWESVNGGDDWLKKK